ncbi:hypothetical protein EHS39_26420 [Ensifer sp. MPMI2T]|nr:hypothetical protein EHS39_26420 [Ensifer sp. MPMI2T]
MSAEFAVGLTRTYAKIADNREFSYETWMDAVRAGHTFVTYGPLMDLNVDGKPMGGRVSLTSSGGTVNISWNVSSVIVPMTRIDLIVNGEVRESRTLKPWQGCRELVGTCSEEFLDRIACSCKIRRQTGDDRRSFVGSHDRRRGL